MVALIFLIGGIGTLTVYCLESINYTLLEQNKILKKVNKK
jgi:hypothetical protein